ncbi:MAG: substrate-binding domain-containing protein [Burkholderiales bacterium]
MKFIKLGLVAAAASVGLSGLAYSPSSEAQFLNSYVSGASALRNTMSRLIAIYCRAGTGAVYELTTPPVGTQGQDFRAYSCTFKTAADAGFRPELTTFGLAGQTALIRHTVSFNGDIGGSITGVTPLTTAINVTLPFLEPGTVNFVAPVAPTGCAANGTDAATGFLRFNCPTTANRRPEWGVSDAEPAVHINFSRNRPTIAPWNQRPVGVIGTPLFVQGFGFIVNTGLATVTNVSTTQATAILGGTYDNWSQLGGPNVPITVCRRTAGSGTQSVFNELIQPGPATEVVGGGPFGQLTVVESPATSGVRTCVAGAAGGIGIIGLDNNTPVANTKFIAIDNVQPHTAPSTINENLIQNGTYNLWVESTINQHPTTLPAAGTAPRNFFEMIKANGGDPGITLQLPGILASCDRGSPPRAVFPAGDISNFTRGGATSPTNSQYCAF